MDSIILRVCRKPGMSQDTLVKMVYIDKSNMARKLAKLEKDGYDGYFSLEWEKKWHPELGDLENVLKDFIELVK